MRNLKWSYKEMSTCLNYLFELNHIPKNISVKTDWLNDLCVILNKINTNFDYTPSHVISALFKFKNKKFFKTSIVNVNEFYADETKKVFFIENNFKEELTKALLKTKSKFKVNFLNLELNDNLPLFKNLEILAKTHNLLKIEVCAILYEAGYIYFEKNEMLKKAVTEAKKINKKAVASNLQMSLDFSDNLEVTTDGCEPENSYLIPTENTSQIILGDVVPEVTTENNNEESAVIKIKILSSEISKAFNHLDDNYNLYLLNDGTGSGKTHNSVVNYLKSYHNLNSNALQSVKRRNLIFVVPQKNQFFINADVIFHAVKNNIPLLFPRPVVDFIDLDSACFIYLRNEKIGKVKDFLDDTLDFSNSEIKEIDANIFNLFKTRLKEASVYRKKDDDSEDEDDSFDSDSDTEDENYIEDNKGDDTFKSNFGDRSALNEKRLSIKSLISSYDNYKNFQTNNGWEQSYNPDMYKENFDRAKSAFSLELTKLAYFLARNIKDEELFKIFSVCSLYEQHSRLSSVEPKKQAFYKLVFNLILYVLPFEAAKFINSIVYLSGDKTKTLLYLSEVSKKYPTLKVIKGYDLEDLVSGYYISPKADVLEAYKKPENFNNFLEKEYFRKNENSYFLNNNIPFSIVEDEEHVLYNKFIDNYTFRNITEDKYGGRKLNLVHALAGIDRWIKNSKVNKRNITNFPKIVDEKNKIVHNLFELIKVHTSLKNNAQIERFFSLLDSNDFGIFVKASDIDFISTVCENIVSFSPKIMVLQEYLEQIQMVISDGQDSLLIAKNLDGCSELNNFYSVYDLFKIILIILYVCRNSSGNLRSLLYKESSSSHQNLALYYLIVLASNNKDFLHNLFKSSLSLDSNSEVNIQFSYFLTKIGFNFLFPEKISRIEYKNSFIKIEPQVFIIKELPEVGILQMLKNPGNKVFLMSATRGFNNVFSGNYSEHFFNDINNLSNNTIKIFKRENQLNNPLPDFVEARHSNRKSVEVIKVNFDGKSSVKSLVYSVASVALNDLNKVNDLVPVTKTYNLIKNTNGINYLSNILYLAKKTNAYNNLWCPYKRIEIEGVLNSIVHAFENKENSIVMTLSNRFEDFLLDEMFMNTVFKSAKFLCENENKHKIFEFSPLVDEPNKKLRVVLFDSELGRMQSLNEYFKVDEDTTVVLVSSYGSAGTGLNLTLRDQNNNSLDFSSLYFVSSPYYTNIMNEDGFASLSNQILTYKYFAHMNKKTISDLSEGLSSKEIKYVLFREHIMEKVKSLMQSAGRIERRDFQLDTKIYFVENELNSFFDETMSHFNQMFNLHSNMYKNTVVANFSMLNKSLLKVALNFVAEKSLTVSNRNKLEKDSNAQYLIFSNFFNKINGLLLNKYRSCDPDYYWVADFNKVLRDYRCPTYNLKEKLKDFIRKHEIILKKTAMFTEMVQLMKNSVLELSEYGITPDKSITIDFNNYKYSDCTNSSAFITDKFLFDYSINVLGTSVDNSELFLKNIMSKFINKSTLTFLPNLYMTHIIRGNIGEMILEEYFNYLQNQNGVVFSYNDIASYFNKNVEQKIYEVFDFYIVKPKEKIIYAIDTKNWSLYNDSGARKTLTKIKQKLDVLKSIPEFKGFKIKCIYLNMFADLNSAFTHGLSLHLSNFKEVDYMNFLVKEFVYQQARNNKGQVIKKSDYEKKKTIIKINQEWKDVL